MLIDDIEVIGEHQPRATIDDEVQFGDVKAFKVKGGKDNELRDSMPG